MDAGMAPAPRQLFHKALREEFHRHVDLALQALGHLDQGARVAAIRAVLASRDRRLWAQALESGMQLREVRPFKAIAHLLESEREGRLHHLKPPGRSTDPSSLLA